MSGTHSDGLDPMGSALETVIERLAEAMREIRADIERHVKQLLETLPAPAVSGHVERAA